MWIQHKDKIIFLLSTFVSLSVCDPCTPEFLHNLKDVVQLTYNYRTGVLNKMIMKMVDNQPFMEMFTENCRQVSNLRVAFREVGSGDWRNYTGRRGSIRLNRYVLGIKNIDPCAEYEVKIVAIVEDGTETDSEILIFGPFYKELDDDVVKENLVGVDAMPDISESIYYSNINSSGFTVSWGTICAQSLNFYLLSGPGFLYEHNDIPYKTMTNIHENDSDNSLWISTEPCHQYKIAIESFMTKEPIPEEDNDGRSRDHKANHDVTTDPVTDTLITSSMEEGSYLLTWQFIQQTDCVFIITYEILLIPETGEAAHPLRQGDWMDQSTELDLTEATYTACSNYQLEMKISYTTSAGNSGERTVFNRQFKTNQLGQFASEGTNDLIILEDSVAVTFGTCAKDVLVVLVDTNDYPIVEFKVIPDYPNTELEAFNEFTMPCASYKIALRGLDGQVFDQKPFLVKRPQGHVSFEQTGFTTSTLEFAVEDIEENRECEVSKYSVKCQPQEEKEEGSGGESEFVGESINGSFVEVRNLAPITSYNCEATIQYTRFEDNTDVNSTEGVGFVTEGFDSLEIANGNIIVTCESKVEQLQLALVHSDGTRITTIDANCTNEQSIDIFARFKQPCVEYSLELFEKDNLDVYDLSSSSNLEVIDSAILPVKPPESNLEMDFLRSDDDSLEFKIENSVENQYCDIETYSITCNMVNLMEVNGGNEGKTEESEIAAIRVGGLIRGEAYSCSAHVTYLTPENVTDQWLGASKPMEVNTEGFDSFYLTEDNSIVVKCESNIEQLKLVLVEVVGAKVAAKDAICDKVDSIDNFMEHTKPCGEYKLELISRHEYDYLVDMGHWDDRQPMVFKEELLDVKMPEGEPEIRLINTDVDNAEFEIVDERNALCEMEITELWCLGEGADTKYITSNNSLSIKVVDLTPETMYSCFATITYTPLNNETDSLDQYENLLNETFSLRSNSIPIQTLPLPTEPPTILLPTEPPTILLPTEPPTILLPTEPPFIAASTKPPVKSQPIPVHPYPTPHTRSVPPSDNSPAIIGAIVGLVIVLAIIIIVVVLKRKRSVNNNNLTEKESATVKVDLAESTVMVEENTAKENSITNNEKEDDVIIKNGATKGVHVGMEIEDVLKGKESVESGFKESSL